MKITKNSHKSLFIAFCAFSVNWLIGTITGYEGDVTKTRNGMINGTIHGMKVNSLVDLLRTATHEGRLL